MEKSSQINTLIQEGHINEAINLIDELLNTDYPPKDQLYYLLGNAYRKQGNWQQALNNYQYAIDLNAESPAVEARSVLMNILEFFNKDMYNQ